MYSQSLPTNLPSNSAISNEWMLPSPTQLDRAASLPLIAPSGLRVPFGALFAHKRSIIVFIRHFWCPLCQDYMSSLASLTPRDANVVVISNGSPALIDKYKAIFGARFEMYVDPGMEVYRSLGMGTTGDVQSKKETHTGYVRRGTLGGIAMVVLRALRVGMPVWEKGGEIGQLGGEFVLGPGMTCHWAHRMQTVKGHAPVPDVLAAAGVSIQQPVAPMSRAKRRESMAPTGFGVRTSVSWSVDDRRKSLTIEEQWIRAGYMKKSVGSRHVVEDREEIHHFVEEPADEVVLFKE
ncbi:hypothetical protein CPB85DRAFT_1229681 [Mucidula mucida]|nr:hypothetical protein CPB85DRAFT_1229681 [Mucidula mucida]